MKIFIGMPCYNQVIHSETAQDLLDLVLEVKERNDQLSILFPSSPFISLNRNLIMQKGLDSDWILMWDNDIQVPTPKFIYKMIETAYKKDATLVGLAVRIKNTSEELACGLKDEGGYTRLKKPKKSPQEVDVMGAGVSLINCKWVRDNLEQPYYEFQDGKGVNGPTIMPEDWKFCEKVKEKGGKIILDPTIETIHWGSYGFQYEI